MNRQILCLKGWRENTLRNNIKDIKNIQCEKWEKNSDERWQNKKRAFGVENYTFRRIIHFQTREESVSEGIAKIEEYRESSKNKVLEASRGTPENLILCKYEC